MSVSRSYIIRIIILIFVIVAGFLIYSGYKYFFGSINSEYQLAAIRDIKEITDNIDTEIEHLHDEEEQISQDAEIEEKKDIYASEETAGVEPTSSAAPDPQKTEAIKNVYEKGLLQLQEQANSAVDVLLANAKSEYIALKEAGAGKSAVLDLALSYMGKANAMEKEVDAGFNSIISSLSSELALASVPKADIETYIAGLRSSYKNQKDQRRNIILDKAKNYL